MMLALRSKITGNLDETEVEAGVSAIDFRFISEKVDIIFRIQGVKESRIRVKCFEITRT
jgi:hypothetical protein